MDMIQKDQGILLTVFLSVLVLPNQMDNRVSAQVYGNNVQSKIENKRLQSLLFNKINEHPSALLSTSKEDEINYANSYAGKKYLKKKQLLETNSYNIDQSAYSGEYDQQFQTSDISSSASDGSLIHKRGNEVMVTEQEAVVDLLVLVDNSIYHHYLIRYNYNHKKAVRSIRRYYKLLINLIDSRYKEMKGLNMAFSIQICDIFIIDNEAKFGWSENGFRPWVDVKTGRVETVLEPHAALTDLQNWLVQHSDEMPPYDHAMAFTRHWTH